MGILIRDNSYYDQYKKPIQNVKAYLLIIFDLILNIKYDMIINIVGRK